MAPPLRKTILVFHVASTVGWMGAVAVFVALDLVARADPEVNRVVWLALDATGWTLLVPLAIASLATGVIAALGTSWGLLRHYWVLFKLLITAFATLILILQTPSFSARAELAADPAVDAGSLGSELFHTGGGFVVLSLALILSIFKPRGLTRYGQRKRLRESHERIVGGRVRQFRSGEGIPASNGQT
ncbi:DUF2269 domain-containing protein [Glycomyces sp. NPDC021274]|uniref:DUF2269 domain-containing protein n=1 Tax=Glycomyces sp. NPDC021274 TaxID=3155120 RepID=UPI0033FBBA4F